MPYPHVKVLVPSDAVALVVPSLEKGDFPILCEFEGDIRKIGSVTYSALTLLALVRISPLELCLSADNKKRVNEVGDILEAMA